MSKKPEAKKPTQNKSRAAQFKKAKTVGQDLTITSVSLKGNLMTFGITGSVTVEMNDEKGQFLSKTVGTPFQVK